MAGIWRTYKDTWARVGINGIYPSGPNQPFGGFGLIDPNRGIIFQQQNHSWSTLDYSALEITVAKNMSNNFQLMAGVNRQCQEFTYLLPWNMTLAGSYTVLAGPWSGPIVDQLPANDPQLAVFGPASIRLPNGTSQSNPLATRMRFVYPTRGEGQVQAPAIKTLGITLNKSFKFGSQREFVAGVSIFNVLNAGDYTQYNYSGANEVFNTANFLQLRNQQAARAAQLTLLMRF